MSLKTFHVLFIVVSVLLAAGFGLWCLVTEKGASVAGSMAMGIVSLVLALALAVYLVKFVKKLRREGIE
jgi:hypothetical protein